MIRSQDQKIILSQLIHQSSESTIKLLNLTSVSFRISSMPPQSVKIHQIHKAEAMKIFFTNLNRLLHAMHRTVWMVSLCNSLTTENIIDLSNTNHIKTCILQCI